MKKLSLFLAVLMMIVAIPISSFAQPKTETKLYRVKSSVIIPVTGTYDPTVKGLRLRKDPGLKSKVVGYLYPGDWVSISHSPDFLVQKDGYTWGYATKQSDGLSGWVAMKYLEEIG